MWHIARPMMLGLLICGYLMLGCEKEVQLPPVPPPPEDLSTWSVPELVQPPPPPAPAPEPVMPKERKTAAEQVLDFTPGTTFTLHVSIGAPLDMVLARGEHVRNIVGGDRTPQAGQQVGTSGGTEQAPTTAQPAVSWEIKEGADGLGETLRHHLFISAAAPGKTTGFIVTTTQRTYYLTCKSVGKSPIRVVRWRYPAEPVPATPVKEPGLLPDPAQPTHYHVGYELVGTKPSWQPRQVVDDGKKTYIIYPEVTLFETVPMVRLIGPNGPQLVNARQFLNVVILDQLIPRAALRVGLGEHADVVTITRGSLRTIACPGDPACPVWPQAAQTLAHRQTSAVSVPEGVQP